MIYRYHLSTKARKYICPACGKKTFTPYVDDDDKPVDVEKYGRCDRENNCAFIKYPPRDPDAVPSLDDLTTRRTPKPKRVVYLPQSYVAHTENPDALQRNPLFVYLVNTLADATAVRQAWQRYHVGTNNNDPSFSCWWQIDTDGKVRTGHFMQYKDNGHRKKENPYSQTWAHALLKRAHKLDDADEIEQCLFGLHLLNEPDADGKPVYLFESEKTALVASIMHPDALCMATAGCASFKSDKLKALQGRRVLYFADDDDAGGRWNASTAADLVRVCNLVSLTRANWLNLAATLADYTPASGWDYCDVLLRLMAPDTELPTVAPTTPTPTTPQQTIDKKLSNDDQAQPIPRCQTITTDDKLPFEPLADTELPF